MMNHVKHEFLFKCEDCETILSIKLEDEEDLKKVQENKMILECVCGSKCFVLRD